MRLAVLPQNAAVNLVVAGINTGNDQIMKNRSIKINLELSESGVTSITQAFFDNKRSLLKVRVDDFDSPKKVEDALSFAQRNAQKFDWSSKKKHG